MQNLSQWNSLSTGVETIPIIMHEYSFPTYRAFEDYKQQQLPILIWVFEHLTSDPKTAPLKEALTEEGLFEQLSYHQKLFMSACEFRSSVLLRDYMQWRYRVLMSRGIDADYFILENNSWIKALRIYLFEGYSGEVISLYETLLSEHEHFKVFQTLPKIEIEKHPHLSETLTHALLNSDEEGVHELFRTHLYHFGSPIDFFDNVIKPTMIEIGKRWENNLISVAKEHIATAMVERVWNHYSLHDLIISSPSRYAFVITPEGQLHKLGSKMVATLLHQKGWKVAQLALDETFRELYDAINEFRPQIIILSASMAIYIPLLQRLANALKEDGHFFDGKIIVGGQAFYRTTPPIYIENADFQGETLQELEGYLDRLTY